MRIEIHADKARLGAAAAREGARAIAESIAAGGEATVVLATGASQFEMLDELVAEPLDWSKVTAFHLDEYVGIDANHRASFRRYLRERVSDRLPRLGRFVMIEGDAPDISAEVSRLNSLLAPLSVDVCFAGIGENCHLAFNDPPADFETTDPYMVVELDEACRRQQAGEGWFASPDDVPRQAVSMSIGQIMKSRKLILAVSDSRKAVAVRDALQGPVSPRHPASIVQRHGDVTIHADSAAAALLDTTS